jgi:hypothetical protein
LAGGIEWIQLAQDSDQWARSCQYGYEPSGSGAAVLVMYCQAPNNSTSDSQHRSNCGYLSVVVTYMYLSSVLVTIHGKFSCHII